MAFDKLRPNGLYDVHRHASAAALECDFNGLDHAGFFCVAEAETICHHVQHFSWPRQRGDFTLSLHLGEAAEREPLRDLIGRSAGGQLHWEGHHQAWITLLATRLHFGINCLRSIVPHRLRRLLVKQRGCTRDQELEVVVQLSHRAHGGTRAAHRVGLVNGNGRGHALHLVHSRLVHAVQKLACIGREGLHVAALPLGVKRVKHQAGFARAARTGDHRQLTRADVEIEVFEVVLARAANADGSLGHGSVSFLMRPDILGTAMT